MSNRSVDLVVNIVEGRTDAVDAFDDVSDGAARMSRAVDDAGAKAERNGRRFAVSAEGADNLASKSGMATGALGALSSGFELVGLEKYAEGLQSASLATDFLSGVGDSLTLVMESQRLTQLRSAIASRAAAAATTVQATAQRVLNAVMRANPIGLIITAVLALVAGIVLLYNRSETFRNIVQAVGRAGREAIGWIVDRARDLLDWVADRLPGGFRRMREIAGNVLDAATQPFRTMRNVVENVRDWVADRLPGGFERAKDKARDIGAALLAPFQAVRDMIDRIIGAIGRIKFPSIPKINLPGFGARMAAPEDDGGSFRMMAAPVDDTSSMRAMSAPGDTLLGALTDSLAAGGRLAGGDTYIDNRDQSVTNTISTPVVDRLAAGKLLNDLVEGYRRTVAAS